MIPGQDPTQMINGDEPSLKKRYNREPEATTPPIQFNMQAAYGPGEEYEEDSAAPQYPPQNQQQYQLDAEDDELYPGGPSRSQVLSWKKQFNNRVYLIDVNEDTYIFRTLTRYEYKQIVGLPGIDPLQREEIICETCVLWPQGLTWQNMAGLDAGLPAMVAENVLDKSGFTKNIRVSQL